MNISIRLPDGSSKTLPEGSSVFDLARSIAPGLAKSAVLGVVNDVTVDIGHRLADDDRVKIVTTKDALGLETLRHSAAHLMAAALLDELPGAQLTIGPTTDDGFYYDIFLPEGLAFGDNDFPRIEARIKKLAKAAHKFERCVATTEEDPVFREYMDLDGGSNKFKSELVEGLKQQGALSGAEDALELSFYRTGKFIDLCRGPHVPNSKWLTHIKLMKVAGAYWRADANCEQLVRVYGTAFFTKADLDAHLYMLEEAKKRDHRLLGEKLDLFHFEEDAPGFPFLHANGAIVYNSLMEFMRAQLGLRDYQEVRTPLILPESTWHTSGHYDHYMENMFFTKRKLWSKDEPSKIIEDSAEDRPMAVKPMNCPGHLMIYKHRLHSHRELPLRMAEMGQVHRREPSGVRHGMFRVQTFVQDDAHHFCTPNQIKAEIELLIHFFFEVYQVFGLGDVRLELSTRPEKSIGSDEMWTQAESSLESALKGAGRAHTINPGDGAFYGPKIDFHIRDSLGRSWQCGTIQLDFSMPQRFGLEYVGSDGERHTPVMIHRACYGSVERFFGIITEHVAGAFPLWLAPQQARILPISEKYNDYACEVEDQIRRSGVRATIDRSDERLGYKIRNATMQKVPYIIVVGEKEATANTINVRARDGDDIGETTVDKLLAQLPPWSVSQLMRQLASQRETDEASSPKV